MGAGAVHHLGELAAVLVDGARAQQVVVERLLAVVLHEQGRAQRIEQRDLADVGVGVMGENARVHIALRVDVQVAAPAGNTAAHELAVVLEVEREQGLGLAHLTDETVQVLTLLGVGHQARGRVHANRHVREYPGEQRALVDKVVEVLLGSDGIPVLGSVAAGNAERQPVGLQQLHGMLHLGVDPFTTTAVGGFLEAFGAKGGHEVLHADHFLAERLVDERAVGEG